MSLLSLNQLFICFNSDARTVWISCTLLLEEKSAVSSAYKVILHLLTTLGRSLIKTMNNNGPRTDHWGTPTSISWESEIAPLTEVIVTDNVHFKLIASTTPHAWIKTGEFSLD